MAAFKPWRVRMSAEASQHSFHICSGVFK